MAVVNQVSPPSFIGSPWMTENYFNTPELEAMFRQVAGANPMFVERMFSRDSPAYTGTQDPDRFSSYEEYQGDLLREMLVEEYGRNQQFYDSYDSTGANPNSYWYDPTTKSYVYGVDPGISLEESQYGRTAEGFEALKKAEEARDAAYARDYNRFAIDPNTLKQAAATTYDPALADVYTTDFANTFDPTRGQLDYANALNQYAMQLDGSYLGSAAELQYLAATGQMPSLADMRLEQDANALYAAQMAMAARARGSSGAGLANLQAMNNSALGYGQLLNAADMARAQEMADARAQFGQTALGIRQGDLQGAAQATQNANTLYNVNNSELGAQVGNTEFLNQGEQFNTGEQNRATEFNIGETNKTDQFNAEAWQKILEGNREYGFQTQGRDDLLAKDYGNIVLAETENDRGANIEYEQNVQDVLNQTADRKANIYTQNQSASAALTGQRELAEAQQFAGMAGAVGAGIGGLADLLSDKRAKSVGGEADVADFSGAKDFEWKYNEKAGKQLAGYSSIGPMAQDLPDDIVEEGEDGMLRVNVQKAIMRSLSALGDAQRRIAALEES